MTITKQKQPSCFVSKLTFFLDLSVEEGEALADFEKNERAVARGEAIYREGDAADELFVVKSGWLYSSRYTDSGQRQVVQLRHPGDLCGMHDLILTSRSHSLIALEDSVVCPLPQSSLKDLMRAAPRAMMLINGLAALDHVFLFDLVQAIARTSADDRIIYLLLQLLHRLRINNAAMDTTFRLPMNQTLIGDMLGLTNVTVSKSFTELERLGLISRDRGTVTFLELDEAVERIDFRNKFDNLDVQWLQ